MLGGSTCARQNPVISEGTDRWRCGGGLSGHAVSRVPVTSAPTIGYTRDSSQGASAAPRRAVLANLRGKNVRKHPLATHGSWADRRLRTCPSKWIHRGGCTLYGYARYILCLCTPLLYCLGLFTDYTLGALPSPCHPRSNSYIKLNTKYTNLIPNISKYIHVYTRYIQNTRRRPASGLGRAAAACFFC